jgi:hypothetical protein
MPNIQQAHLRQDLTRERVIVMNKNEIKKLYKRAYDHWGMTTQLGMTITECNELSAEIGRFIFQKRKTMLSIIEELADVEIMIEQCRTMIGDELIDEQKQIKLKRLENKLVESEAGIPGETQYD